MGNADDQSKLRLDKWLWAARFFKTRALAKSAIDGGKIRSDGERVKASREISVGDHLTIRQGHDTKVVKVTALSDKRRGAPEAALLYVETTDSKARREQRAAERKAGAGGFIPSDHKPTKKERRQLKKLLDTNRSAGKTNDN